MADAREAMQVVYIDPDERALFVALVQDSSCYTAFTQRRNDAPRRLVSAGYIDKSGYTTQKAAQEALDLHVSNKRNDSGCHRWDVLVNGKSVSWDTFFAIRRGEQEPPALVPTATITALNNIEYRIAHHMQSAYGEFLSIGRCLNEAKDSELVPHGQWVEWVKRHTGMSERQAQRLMSAARQATPDSRMASLPFSKLQAILMVPEPEREEMAQRVQDEGMSTRELLAAIKAQKDAEERALELKARLEGAERAAKRHLDSYNKAIADREGDIANAEQVAREAAQAEINGLARRLNEQLAEERRLRRELETMRESADAGPVGVGPEAQAEIDRLRAEISAQEAYVEQQAAKRQSAERELLQLRQQVARGETGGTDSGALTLEAFAEATRVFIAKSGPLPHMVQQMLRIGARERETWQTYVGMVSNWLEGAQAAMSIAERVVDCDE